MLTEERLVNQWGIDKHCLGCAYYTKIHDAIRYCGYIFKEDKPRPCPPGKGCTVKKVEWRKKDGNT